MKTKCIRMDWVIPVLGIAVVAGSIVAGSTYLNLVRRTQAAEALTVTLDRLYQDQKLSTVLKSFHDGDVAGAVQRLDWLLCANIVRTDSEQASADEQTRVYVQDIFRRIALTRPRTARGPAAGPARECCDDQIAAERILDLTLANEHIARAK